MNLKEIHPDTHTLEQVIAYMMTKIIEQGAVSVGELGGRYRQRCLYRSEAGCCAVGHLIDDNDYHQDLEGEMPLDGLLGELEVDEEMELYSADRKTRLRLDWLLAFAQGLHDGHMGLDMAITRESLLHMVAKGTTFDGALLEDVDPEWARKVCNAPHFDQWADGANPILVDLIAPIFRTTIESLPA